jgi:hypothetical protein
MFVLIIFLFFKMIVQSCISAICCSFLVYGRVISVSRHFFSWWVGDAFLMGDYELILTKKQRYICHQTAQKNMIFDSLDENSLRVKQENIDLFFLRSVVKNN